MWNIILDIDGTLVDEDLNLRPGVQDFIDFVFTEFSTVSIWSAADPERVEAVVQSLKLPDGKSFRFIWTSRETHRSISVRHGEFMCRPTKNLKRIYKAFPTEFTMHNTLIVDDTPHTYRYNVGNSVPILTWYGYMGDKELLRVMNLLRQWKKEFLIQGSVRHFVRH